jgi:hypothetical protein
MIYIATAIAYDFALIKQFYLINIIIKHPFITYLILIIIKQPVNQKSEKNLSLGESNSGLTRDRRVYWPLYEGRFIEKLGKD